MRAEDCRTAEEARAWCLNAERDRERKRRETGQGAFDAAMLSLDAHMETFDDPSKIAAFSDGGAGAAAIRDGGADAPADVIDEALGLLPERDREFAQAVLDGKSWREMGMPKRTFNWRMKKVCSLIAHPPAKPSLET